MIDKDFPCKTCGHIALHHYSNISDGLIALCFVCLESVRSGQWIEPEEHLHEFVGDNLKYMELFNKRKEMLNEQD